MGGMYVCMYVCMYKTSIHNRKRRGEKKRERERERECVCVCFRQQQLQLLWLEQEHLWCWWCCKLGHTPHQEWYPSASSGNTEARRSLRWWWKLPVFSAAELDICQQLISWLIINHHEQIHIQKWIHEMNPWSHSILQDADVDADAWWEYVCMYYYYYYLGE